MKTKILFLSLVFFCGLISQAQNSAPEFKDPMHILVFSKTSGFRHASISSGLKMLYDLSKQQNWIITATEDASLITDDLLKTIDVAVFLNPTQDVLDDTQQTAFEKFIKSGKGFIGIHASADCEYDWAWYGQLNGGYFKTHPPAQEATVIMEDTEHVTMKPFKGMKTYTTVDEWYTFKENPRAKVNVLARLDESTVTKSNNDNWKMGDHPLIWWHEFEGSRAYYTVFGHTHEAFQDEKIIEHLKLAVNWAGRRIN